MLSHPISPSVAELIGRHLRVVGQPVRIRLIDVLRDGRERSVGELAESVGINGFDASKHLAVLLSAGVVRQRRAGRHSRYRLAPGSRAMQLYDLVICELEGRSRERALEVE